MVEYFISNTRGEEFQRLLKHSWSLEIASKEGQQFQPCPKSCLGLRLWLQCSLNPKRDLINVLSAISTEFKCLSSLLELF
jgi:hypothetical protein